MISAKRLSGLLAALHAVPLEQQNWPVFLSTLCEQLEALQCFYITAGVNQPIGVRANGGPPFDMDDMQRYNEHYHQSDPYSTAFPLKPRIGPIIGEELVERGALERTEFYRYHSKVSGMHHAMFLPAVLTSGSLELITIWRTLHQKPFDAESSQLLDLLLPHVQAALQTQRLLAAAGARARRAELALDVVATAAFILDGGGRVVHHNAAAESMLELHDGLAIRNRQLYAADPLIQGKLQALIASAAAAGGALLARPGGMLTLPRPSGKRSLQVMVSPLRLPGAFLAAHVLVAIGDPDRAASHLGVILSSLYGLTRAEVDIANALLAGRTIGEIAEQRRVTAGTLRIQMKSIFLKTDTRRQSDLLKLLLSLPAAPATDDRVRR